MNRRFLSFLAIRGILVSSAALVSAIPALASSGFVYETEAEFQTLADADGDGFSDLVVVDKITGQFRVANGTSDGSLVWRTHSGNSGLPGVTGFSTGPIFQPGIDALLFSEPFANRIQIIESRFDQPQTEPVRIPTDYLGPQLVTAMNAPAGVPGYDKEFFDIVYHSVLQSEDRILSVIRNGGSLPGLEFGTAPISESRRPNRILLETGNLPVYGLLETSATGTEFNIYDPATSPMSRIDGIPELPENADYVYADFAQDGNALFLFFVPGFNALIEVAWNGSALSLIGKTAFENEIAAIRVIESAGHPELLILHADGTAASRVAWDGPGKFPIQETFQSPPGESFSGAASIGSRLHLLSGDATGRSNSLATYLFSGDTHSLEKQQTLTPLHASEAGSSVLLFDKPPLLHSDAILLSQLQAGPWTSAFALTPGSAKVVSETFRGTAGGLGDGQPVTLASPPPATGGGLTNQLSPDLSLLFQSAPIGQTGLQLQIDPPGGNYSQAVRLELTAIGAPAVIRYRAGQSDWKNYDPANPPIFISDIEIHAFAQNAAGVSNVVHAQYVFPENPASQDSNGDGLPDFVAQKFGLDPLSPDFDSDGDGFSDLDEILAGTDPLDFSSKPARGDVAFSFPNSFDLAAAPAIPDPNSPVNLLRPFAAGGTSRPARMNLHQPNGFFLGGSETSNTPLLPIPLSLFSGISVADPELFAIAISEANFPVNSAGAKDYGRQVAAIVPIPKQEFEPFHYTDFGANGGFANLPAETSAWIHAARTFHQNLQRATVIANPVGPKSTLALLLTENFLGHRLHAHNFIDRPNISLTPFRNGENPLAPDAIENPASGRDRAISQETLRGLQSYSTNGPSYKIREIVATIENAVTAPPTPEIGQLIELANRLYTTSATNPNPGSLRQPFDAIRQFIRHGDLVHTGFDNPPAAANFPVELLAAAALGIEQIENLIPTRTLETFAFFYDGNPAENNCRTWREVLYTPGSFDPDSPILFGPTYSLVDEHGNPFPVARAFPLTAGSVFEVSGFVDPGNGCGDLTIELVSQPDLLFLRNSAPTDLDGDLIPDAIQELLGEIALSPFADTDGDGYSDLQEIFAGSDPADSQSIPLLAGVPAPVLDPSPPRVTIDSNEAGHAIVSFDYPPELTSFIEFQLYNSVDLRGFSATGLKAAADSSGRHTLILAPAGHREFYIFRMNLK